jgi:hypothetical protein
MLTLDLLVWSMTPMVEGDGREIANSDEVLRKGMLKLDQFLAPLDACFRTGALHVEAHILDLLTNAGAAPVVGFFLDSGETLQKRACNRGS